MQNHLTKFKKIPLIISIILLGLSFAIFIFLYKQIQNNDRISGEMERQWLDEANKREEIKSLDLMLKTIESERALLDSHFIKSSDVVPFLNLVEQLAKDAGAGAEVILIDILKDNSGLVVGINAKGNFEALYKFLTLLENSPYELEIISMDLLQSQAGDITDKKNLPPQWSAIFKIKLLSF